MTERGPIAEGPVGRLIVKALLTGVLVVGVVVGVLVSVGGGVAVALPTGEFAVFSECPE